MKLPCSNCGTIDTEDNRNYLFDLYHRVNDGGRKYNEPMVFTADDFGHWDDPDEEYEIMNMVMEKNMAERGLCPKCGIPDLRGYTEDDFYTEEEARQIADMYGEMRAERLAGC